MHSSMCTSKFIIQCPYRFYVDVQTYVSVSSDTHIINVVILTHLRIHIHAGAWCAGIVRHWCTQLQPKQYICDHCVCMIWPKPEHAVHYTHVNITCTGTYVRACGTVTQACIQIIEPSVHIQEVRTQAIPCIHVACSRTCAPHATCQHQTYAYNWHT